MTEALITGLALGAFVALLAGGVTHTTLDAEQDILDVKARSARDVREADAAEAVRHKQVKRCVEELRGVPVMGYGAIVCLRGDWCASTEDGL